MSSLRIRKRRIRSCRRLITHFRQTPYRSPESVFYFWKTDESIPRPGAQPTSGTGMVSSHSDTKPVLPDSYAASRCIELQFPVQKCTDSLTEITACKHFNLMIILIHFFSKKLKHIKDHLTVMHTVTLTSSSKEVL